jgi:glyoxylase-like metal-dependent hydrolase (beta-lactamase superfamily II)
MTVRCLNAMTCSARLPRGWHTGALCLLWETQRGLALVDTGLGREDYERKHPMLRFFQRATIVPLDPQEAAVRQVARLGYDPAEVRDVVLTHMHFDHCGGLPDFPQARVHVHHREHEAFTGKRRGWSAFAYVRRHVAHGPNFVLHEEKGESWYDFPAVRLPLEPETWLVPLFGHTPGHCGVALRTPSGWLFHVGDAAPISFAEDVPRWAERLALGPHTPRLRAFRAAHPEVRLVTGHMWLDFFDEYAVVKSRRRR